MDNSYFKDQEKDCEVRIRKMLKELPKFCESFFMSIETTKQPRTRLAYCYDLRTYFEYLLKENPELKGLSMHDIPISIMDEQTADDIQEYISAIRMYEKGNTEITNAENGLKRKLSSIRSLYNYLYKHGKVSANPAALVDSPKIHEHAIIRLDNSEVSKLLDDVDSGQGLTKNQMKFHEKTRVRDLAIITLLLGTGIRVSECVGLNISDVDFENSGIKIHRKGGNEAIVYFGDEVRDALADYMEEREQMDPVQGHEDALFLSLQRKRMGVRSVEKLVKKYAQTVTTLKKITPHKLRSTYGTALYQETGDIYLVADVLGHKDVNTTRRHYAAMQENNRKRAANAVKLRSSDENSEETESR